MPIVLAYLAAERLRRDARDTVRAGGLGGTVDVGVTGGIGRGARIVYVTLAVDPQEFAGDESDALLGRLAGELRLADVDLIEPDEGFTTDAFWEGEQLQLRRR